MPMNDEWFGLFLSHGVEMTANVLVHLEHVNSWLLENGLHLCVAYDLTTVAGVLELIGLDVLPKFLDDLGSR